MVERKYKILATVFLIIFFIFLFLLVSAYKNKKLIENFGNLYEKNINEATDSKTIYYSWGIGRQGNVYYEGLSVHSLCNTELEKEFPKIDWQKSDCIPEFIQKTGDFQCDSSSSIENDCFVPLNVKCDCDYALLEPQNSD